MTHPLVAQLRFSRSEFRRGLEGLADDEARRRFLPMNCLSWNVGHLAWQEQRYFITFARKDTPWPELNELFAYGAPAQTPSLAEMLAVWEAVTAAADSWLSFPRNCLYLITCRSVMRVPGTVTASPS